MLENYSLSDWPRGDREDRYDEAYPYWNALSAVLAHRYGFEAVLDPDDLAHVRGALGWDRRTVARTILDLIGLDLAYWEPQPDGTALFRLDIPAEMHPVIWLAAKNPQDDGFRVACDLEVADALASARTFWQWGPH
jgi:hypothetical protein